MSESIPIDQDSGKAPPPLPAKPADAAEVEAREAADLKAARPVPILLIVLASVAAAIAGIVLMVIFKPTAEETTEPIPPPAVKVFQIKPETRQLFAASQGTVEPRSQTRLVAEVGGKVESVAPQFEAGAVVKKGDLLLQIETANYEAALAQARAALEEATLTLKQELARAEQAERDWKKLGGQAEGAGAELARRVPQVAAARAHEASMRAAVAKAELDLERTRIVAPYDGRVLDRQADVGFFAAPGTPLGELYSTGIFEVTLPLAPDQFAQLAITLGFDATRQGVEGPPVALAGMFGGTLHDWQGTVARTGGAIDAQTRTVPVVVEVRDEPAAGRPPLAPGMFMRAKVGGVTEENLSPIPRSSLLGDSRVLVVDKENKLQFREVEVAQKTDDEALIRSGFQGGDRVCLTVLDDAVSGMEVAVLNAEPAAAPQL